MRIKLAEPIFEPFADLKGRYRTILADPPWQFSNRTGKEAPEHKRLGRYGTMTLEEIKALPVSRIAAPQSHLYLWVPNALILEGFEVMKRWGFTYKTCAFSWMKADPYRLFADDMTPVAGLGYWTRANTEPCLLATRGKPHRSNADVRQGIIAPRREHSRKPDCVHERIERLVAGPYLELFARQRRKGWTCFGNEVDKFKAMEAV